MSTNSETDKLNVPGSRPVVVECFLHPVCLGVNISESDREIEKTKRGTKSKQRKKKRKPVYEIA